MGWDFILLPMFDRPSRGEGKGLDRLMKIGQQDEILPHCHV